MLVDTADLITSDGVAEALGLASFREVSVYRKRYDDFPEPVLETARCIVWHRPDIEAWKTTHSR